MSNRDYYAQYGGRIIQGGVLELRDPNDNSGARHQYRLDDGIPQHRRLSSSGQEIAAWSDYEAHDLRSMAAMNSPVWLYFQEYKAASALGRKGGASKSEAKVQAARDNGKKGGRPKTARKG